MKIFKIYILILFLTATTGAFAQTVQPPFWEEIQAFKKEESIHFPGTNKILFVGSSSFRLWKGVQAAFSEHAHVLQRFKTLFAFIRAQNNIAPAVFVTGAVTIIEPPAFKLLLLNFTSP